MKETFHIPAKRYPDRVFVEDTVIEDAVIPKGMRLIDVFPNGMLVTARCNRARIKSMNRSTRIKKLEEIYATIPEAHCKSLCQEACGPIVMSLLEHSRIKDATRGHVKNTKDSFPDCPLLADGKCSVYEVRPAICRLFGSAKGMPCPFGCRPDRIISDTEGHAILQAVQDIGGEVTSLL